MTQEELQESSLSDLENELSKVKNRHQQLVEERIHVQVEHDAIQSYREITKQSIHDINLQQKIREFDVHGERDDMAVEIKAYQDKVKQLNFHHELQLEDAQKERNETLQSIRDENDERLGQAQQKKQSLLDQLREQQIANVQEIVQMKQGYENDFENERVAMKGRLDELRKSCADHYQNVEDDLVLRRRVQMREIQEQGNSHIFDLEMRQSETYEKTKVYYEGVSRDNKMTIQKLEDTLQKLEMKDSQYKEEIRKISEINEQMRSPLERSLAEVRTSFRSTLRSTRLRLMAYVLTILNTLHRHSSTLIFIYDKGQGH